MNDLVLSASEPTRELQSIVLENRHLRVTVLPDAGARIWQITYKPLNVDLLWHSPNVTPACQPLHACYDDTWSGGWDELFPNDEAADLQGMALPDHGELWTCKWEATPIEEHGAAVGVHLRTCTPISSFLVEKTLLLRPESAVIEIRYRLTNQGIGSMPFLFKMHPAFAVSSSHRIDFPPMAVLLEREFPGTLDGAPQFSWPYAGMNGVPIDLRRVPDASSKSVHFFYGVGFISGWCGITNQSNNLAAALRFDPEVFSSCWLFASHGGWRDLNVAVLEPATGYPFRIKSMIDEGRARNLDPGESLETTVLFSVQEGLTSIGGVEDDGTILPGDEG